MVEKALRSILEVNYVHFFGTLKVKVLTEKPSVYYWIVINDALICAFYKCCSW